MAPPLLAPDSCASRPLSAKLDVLRAITVTAALTEVLPYLSGSHRSWHWQSEALRDLDDWLRRDIGLPRREPPPLDPWPGRGW